MWLLFDVILDVAPTYFSHSAHQCNTYLRKNLTFKEGVKRQYKTNWIDDVKQT